MKRILLITGLLLLTFNLPIKAIDLDHSKLELGLQTMRNHLGDLYFSEDQEEQTDDIFDFEFNADESIYDYDYRSPKKAFIYSLIIPGWGQKYCGSNALKTLAFIGAEAGLWMGYFKNHNDGQKKTDEYEAFADLNWIEGDSGIADQSYRGWLAIDSLFEKDFTHTLPSTTTQQYYEMIGKYDQFAAGWTDYWDDPAYWGVVDDNGNLVNLTPMRSDYNVMRKDANDLLDKANKFVIFSVLNHLVSAFDAALAARRYNRNQADDLWLSLETDMKYYSATERIPVVKLKINF